VSYNVAVFVTVLCNETSKLLSQLKDSVISSKLCKASHQLGTQPSAPVELEKPQLVLCS